MLNAQPVFVQLEGWDKRGETQRFVLKTDFNGFVGYINEIDLKAVCLKRGVRSDVQPQGEKREKARPGRHFASVIVRHSSIFFRSRNKPNLILRNTPVTPARHETLLCSECSTNTKHSWFKRVSEIFEQMLTEMPVPHLFWTVGGGTSFVCLDG